jgi:small nuclear ribonucleoprotein (snRNP)-like protein
MSRQKDTAVNLAKFIDKSIIVKLAGGREGAFKHSLSINFAANLIKRAPPPLIQSLPLTILTPFAPVLLTAVIGTLKGYDQLLNLVLDEATEYLRGKIMIKTIIQFSHHRHSLFY